MDEAGSFKMLVPIYQTTQHYIPEDSNLWRDLPSCFWIFFRLSQTTCYHVLRTQQDTKTFSNKLYLFHEQKMYSKGRCQDVFQSPLPEFCQCMKYTSHRSLWEMFLWFRVAVLDSFSVQYHPKLYTPFWKYTITRVRHYCCLYSNNNIPDKS
jgi:hypothetical protein